MKMQLRCWLVFVDNGHLVGHGCLMYIRTREVADMIKRKKMPQLNMRNRSFFRTRCSMLSIELNIWRMKDRLY